MDLSLGSEGFTAHFQGSSLEVGLSRKSVCNYSLSILLKSDSYRPDSSLVGWK